ncbi:MAG TPA: 1-deoxy-D-xylulose-5-phosphate reductoisomerase [Acidimicrobiia bacterium]|nr:1-deoxy-D-xylulose-5-phosphate reductoisomerase [Acidimicrobiia bacterium]
MKPLVVLGVTGSIGRQSLEVADHLGWPVVGIGARSPSAGLAEIARSRPEAQIAVAGGSLEEREGFSQEFGARARFGPEALEELSATPKAVVVNGVVGLVGLPLTLAAARAGNRIALANKESMVAAGPLIRRELRRSGGELIPVDSEHSAIFQCLTGEDPGSIERVILTASGGPFRTWELDKLESVTPAEALVHPNWSMGDRITIDSATMANKALEVMEAQQLFELEVDQVEVVIHPESVVHSMVRFRDGSIKAQLGAPDMKLPIAYAVTFPERRADVLKPFDLAGVSLNFEAPDLARFPALALGYAAARSGQSAPAVYNASDEVAVAAFLAGRLGFRSITSIIERTMEGVGVQPVETIDDVLSADREARSLAAAAIAGAC